MESLANHMYVTFTDYWIILLSIVSPVHLYQAIKQQSWIINHQIHSYHLNVWAEEKSTTNHANTKPYFTFHFTSRIHFNFDVWSKTMELFWLHFVSPRLTCCEAVKVAKRLFVLLNVLVTPTLKTSIQHHLQTQLWMIIMCFCRIWKNSLSGICTKTIICACTLHIKSLESFVLLFSILARCDHMGS